MAEGKVSAVALQRVQAQFQIEKVESPCAEEEYQQQWPMLLRKLSLGGIVEGSE